MPRDPERIDRVIEKLRVLWKTCPDMRLGQLLVNVAPRSEPNPLFHIEDDLWEQYIDNPPWEKVLSD